MPIAKRLFAVCTVARPGGSERTFYLYQRDNRGFQEFSVHTSYHNQPGYGDGSYCKTYEEALIEFNKRILDNLEPLKDNPDIVNRGLPTGLMWPRSE